MTPLTPSDNPDDATPAAHDPAQEESTTAHPAATGEENSARDGELHGRESGPAGASPVEDDKAPGWRVWAERLGLTLVVWAAWALITAFLVQPFKIPSESMEKTLGIGDRVVVAKWTGGDMPHRGDVIVFSDPAHWLGDSKPQRNFLTDLAEFTHLAASGDHLVKRVVGIGGDTVSCVPGGKLTVNGTPITETYLNAGQAPCDMAFTAHVPAGKVWVMGDNRGHSADSRFHDGESQGQLGSVPVSDITGRVVSVVWPLSKIGGGRSDTAAFAKVPAPKK